MSTTLILWLSALSLVTFFGSLLALPWLVCRIPEDYFCYPERHPAIDPKAHPAVRYSLLAIKNLLGIFLLLGGIVMLFLPGQGLLTMAMGLLLMDYPGKYRFEQRVVSTPVILKGLNWLRKKGRHPPLKIHSSAADDCRDTGKSA